MREALNALASHAGRDEPVHLAYINPETGDACLPILGFSAMALRPGETVSPPRRSASCVFHVIEGEGDAEIDGLSFKYAPSDTIACPTHARIKLRNNTSKMAYLFMVDDAPMQRKLGFYEEF